MPQTIYTIGFSKKSLRTFVELLKGANVTKLVDTRLNNTSQLAGFAKKHDLAFIMELVGIKYIHEPKMAPTDDILKMYKKQEITWTEYEHAYLKLLQERNILSIAINQMENDTICFLCSEDKPKYCHRRLLAEYIQEKSSEKIVIQHLT